jgi:hypothetical protein
MVFNTTITNISAILWRSAFLVEKSEAIANYINNQAIIVANQTLSFCPNGSLCI